MTTLRDGKFRVSENLELVGQHYAAKLLRLRREAEAQIVGGPTGNLPLGKPEPICVVSALTGECQARGRGA